jgi:hypothetical protein
MPEKLRLIRGDLNTDSHAPRSNDFDQRFAYTESVRPVSQGTPVLLCFNLRVVTNAGSDRAGWNGEICLPRLRLKGCLAR